MGIPATTTTISSVTRKKRSLPRARAKLREGTVCQPRSRANARLESPTRHTARNSASAAVYAEAKTSNVDDERQIQKVLSAHDAPCTDTIFPTGAPVSFTDSVSRTSTFFK